MPPLLLPFLHPLPLLVGLLPFACFLFLERDNKYKDSRERKTVAFIPVIPRLLLFNFKFQKRF
jgi:hypothetical protein